MSKKEKLILKLLAGNAAANFAIEDLIKLLDWLEFEERKDGSHRIFSRAGIKGIINLQATANGKAKTYQVKQVRDFLLKNKILGNE